MRINGLDYDICDSRHVEGELKVILDEHEAAKLFRQVDESRTREFVILPKEEFCYRTMTANSYYGTYGGTCVITKDTKVPLIREVIFNNPATIVIWWDGTKTVVKCEEGDTFDKEKGIALCFMKKINGNKGNYNNIFKEFIKEDEE